MQRSVFALLISLSLATGGCATLLNSGPSQLVVETEPASAAIRLTRDDGRALATVTGARNVLTLDRGHDYVLSAAMEGYSPSVVSVNRKVAAAFWGNLIGAGLGALVLVVPGLTATDNSGLSAGLSLLLGLPIVLLGGAGAIGIDLATGAMWDHDKSEVSFELSPRSPW